MSWLDTAKALRVGTSGRVEHCVSGDKSAVVSAGDSGWSMYCFRCGEQVEFEPYPALSLAERIVKLQEAKALDAAAERSVELPTPIEHDLSKWPVSQRAWLHKAGLFNTDIAALGIYYNARLNRVVLPVMVEGTVGYWQARGFDKSRAKYINPKISNPPLAEFGSGGCIVLVEDYLSAFRVGQVTAAWGLLGTTLKTPGLAKLLHDGRQVVTWLDPDKAGVEKSAAIRKMLRAYGKHVVNIVSTRDPKLLPRSEIAQLLKDNSCI